MIGRWHCASSWGRRPAATWGGPEGALPRGSPGSSWWGRRQVPQSRARACPTPLPARRYALTGKEVQQILKQRLIKVDGKVRTDTTYPTGFMDVVQIEKTDENFRVVFDTKGRFVVHRITKEEAAYKLCKVRRLEFGKGGIPYIVTHDGRTIRYPDPEIKVRPRMGACACMGGGGGGGNNHMVKGAH
jgi:hypothetical protein